MNNSYINAKLKLISKYSHKNRRLLEIKSNVDTFITINDFLSNEMSLGPEAEYGDIYYTYTNYENINNYVKILIDEIGFNKVICMPDFSLKIGDRDIIKNTIAYNVTRDELLIPKDLLKSINKCNNRFIYLNLMIVWEQKRITHVNMIIIDFESKTIERYEPHGKQAKIDRNNTKLSKKIDSKFSDKILSYIGLKNYTYISPFDYSPAIGIQLKVDAYDGMCLTYSIMYLQLRIMNPDVDQKDIVKYLLKKPKSEMYETLLKYAKFIEDKLKENTNEIIKISDELYNRTFFQNIKFIVVNKRNEIDIIEY
jgi:hypothetical protein